MRHAKKGYKLSRTASHRKATLAALSGALIRHKRITTTLTKAKALRIYVEPLITRARADTTHNRREVFRHLMDKTAVTELFDAISEKVGDRPGGYTRILRLGQRQGDAAEMAVIELVDYNESVPETRRSRRRRTRRGGRRRGSTSGQAAARYDLPASSAGLEDSLQVEDESAEVAAPEDALVEDMVQDVEGAPVAADAESDTVSVVESEDAPVAADAESDTVSVAESEDVSAEAAESEVEDAPVVADAESGTVSVAELEDVSAEAEESDVEGALVAADVESDTISVAESENVSAETKESDVEDAPVDDAKESAEPKSDESATGEKQGS